LSERRASCSPQSIRDRQGRGRVKAKKIDLTAFAVHIDEKTTFLFPTTDHASRIEGIMHPAMDAVASGKAEPASLT
jgi:multiple sugar transport system substrate-binding protein